MLTKKSRLQKLVNPKFQLGFAFNCLVPMITMTIVFWLTLETFIRKMTSVGQSQGLPATHEYFKLIQVQRSELLTLLVFFSLVLTVLFFVWGLLYSHRIAGPIFKLTNWLDDTKSMEDAMRNPVQFRKNDLFQEIPESLNKFLKKDEAQKNIE